MGAPLEQGQIVAGRYRVDSLIGEGGMGAVYLVQHVRTEERLAMKVLHPQVLRDDTAVERFRREACAPARIASEHVARVTDADTAPEIGDAPFYVMEFLRGKDLEQLTVENGPLTPALTVEYLRQAARALDKAHAMGIVHRDLKPENLFLTTREDGSPCIKLLDFGIAKLVGQELPTELKTQSGAVFGTPAFMSPEQTLGDVEQVGPPADIWAIGLIAFKLLTGKHYWNAGTIAQLYLSILHEPLAPPSARGSRFGAPFDTWFSGCVSRDISMRFRTAGDAITALATALGVDQHRASAPSNGDVALSSDNARGRGPQASAPAFGPHGTSVFPPPERGTTGAKRRGLVPLLLAIVSAAIAASVIVYALKRGSLDHSNAIASDTPIASASTSGAAADPSAPVVAPGSSEAPAPAGSATTEPSKGSSPASKATNKPKSDKSDEPKKETGGLSDDQRRRLDVLKRLCDSGTYTPAECSAKRAAIHAGP